MFDVNNDFGENSELFGCIVLIESSCCEILGLFADDMLNW